MNSAHTQERSRSASQSFKDEAAWKAIVASDVAGLDAALASGANPDATHPQFGHRLLEQACRCEVKGSAMAAMLIERGATLPAPDDHLAFELSWRALVDDSVLLARSLLEPKEQSAEGEALKRHFLDEKSKYITATPTSLDCMLQAMAAKAAVSELIERHPAPLQLVSNQPRSSRVAGMR